MQDERVHDYLGRMKTSNDSFSFSRASWWGEQFERMVRLVKRSFNKTDGNGTLTRSKLQDVLLEDSGPQNDEMMSSNVDSWSCGRFFRHSGVLSFAAVLLRKVPIEDEIQLPLLTPNSLQFRRPNLPPEAEVHRHHSPDL